MIAFFLILSSINWKNIAFFMALPKLLFGPHLWQFMSGALFFFRHTRTAIDLAQKVWLLSVIKIYIIIDERVLTIKSDNRTTSDLLIS